MQSYRTLSRCITQSQRVIFTPTTVIRKMSLFPRSFINNDVSPFTPLFRMLDNFDQYTSRGMDRPFRTHLKAFTPKFDVKELKDAYELHGELPGIEQKDIEIEFIDPQTLTVKGHTERKYTSSTPPAGLIEGSPATSAITKADETAVEVKKTETPEEKYWVSERSIGQFSRSFSFPTQVDQDQVRASMKNGILIVLVPKSKKHESRKITIS